ncbi:hypothetical protein Tco_0462412 [Tanacetum coccineum]
MSGSPVPFTPPSLSLITHLSWQESSYSNTAMNLTSRSRVQGLQSSFKFALWGASSSASGVDILNVGEMQNTAWVRDSVFNDQVDVETCSSLFLVVARQVVKHSSRDQPISVKPSESLDVVPTEMYGNVLRCGRAAERGLLYSGVMQKDRATVNNRVSCHISAGSMHRYFVRPLLVVPRPFPFVIILSLPCNRPISVHLGIMPPRRARAATATNNANAPMSAAAIN